MLFIQPTMRPGKGKGKSKRPICRKRIWRRNPFGLFSTAEIWRIAWEIRNDLVRWRFGGFLGDGGEGVTLNPQSLGML